jgi:hypothetical protein
MKLTYQIVRRLLRDKDAQLSRNRNFAAYEDPTVQHAARIFRHLRSVEEDLLRLGSEQVRLMGARREGEGLVLELELDDGKVRRTSMLSAAEWGLLLENSAVSDRLEQLLESIDASSREEIRATLRSIVDEEPG